MAWSKIDNASNELMRFIPRDDTATRESLQGIVDEIKRIHHDNITAWIPVSSVTETSADISEYQWMEDYEIVTGYHTAPDNSMWKSEDEYREHLAEKSTDVYKMEHQYVVFDPKYPHITYGWDGNAAVEDSTCMDVEDAEKTIAYLKEFGEDEEAQWTFRSHYVIFKYEDDGLKDMEFETSEESEAEAELEDLRTQWVDDEVSELGEFEYDEIMMSDVYHLGYKRGVNSDLAQDLGMAVVRFIRGEHEGDEYMVAKGAGTDSTPAYVCYKAIEFGYVDENDLRWFDEFNQEFFISVVGQQMFNNALQAMGLDRFITDTE